MRAVLPRDGVRVRVVVPLEDEADIVSNGAVEDAHAAAFLLCLRVLVYAAHAVRQQVSRHFWFV